MPILALSRKTIAAIKLPEKPVTYYDTSLKGFAYRVTPTGVTRWVVEYRAGDGGRGVSKTRMVIGDGATLNVDQARDKARTILASVQLGSDPAQTRSGERKSLTVGEVLEKYSKLHLQAKRKASSDYFFRYLLRRYIGPEFGNKRASSLTRQEVARWHREIGGTGKIAVANRAVAFLTAAYTFCIRYGYLQENAKNPAHGIEKFRETARERYLSEVELSRLGDTMRLAETDGLPWEPDPSKKVKHAPKVRNTIVDPYAVMAIRLLLLTGARKNEILTLRWDWVDLERGLLNLPDSKTGKKVIPLGGPAIALLQALPRLGDMVIAGRDGTKARVDLKKPWDRIREHAGLEGLRIHDLRHSFAAVGAGSGFGLPTIGKLLGHKNVVTTQRYAHLADDPMRRAANAISDSIAASMGPK
jgi:integrase